MARLGISTVRATTIAAVALMVCARTLGADATPAATPDSPAQGRSSLFPALPDDGAESRLPGNRFDFMGHGDSSAGSPMEAPSMSKPPSARAVELLERRRNWIYSTQTPASFDISADQTLGNRSGEDVSWGGKQKGALADFFYDRGTQRTQSAAFEEDSLSRSLQVPGYSTPLTRLDSGLGMPAQNPTLGLTPYQSAAPASANPGAGSSVSGLTSGLGSSPDSGMDVSASVHQLLSSPQSLNPLAGGFDPINLRGDTTRQDLNPTVGNRLSNMRSAPRTVDALLERPTRTLGSDPAAYLDNINTRTVGSSSLSPTTAPSSEVRAANRPSAFGQFPARKF